MIPYRAGVILADFFFLHFLVCTLVFLENEYCTGGESRVITGRLSREGGAKTKEVFKSLN